LDGLFYGVGVGILLLPEEQRSTQQKVVLFHNQPFTAKSSGLSTMIILKIR
jgi:hypothetical protein